MIQDELQEASFRGAFFFLTNSSITGGRKDAKKELVNSPKQVIEDLGLRQPIFSVTGVVAARERQGAPGEAIVLLTYKQMRDSLIDALQSEDGPGVFVHPFYGPIENVVCRTFTIVESMRDLGTATVTMNFEISNTLGTPEELVPVLGTVSTEALATQEAVLTQTTAEWKVSNSFPQNLLDAIAKTESFIDDVQAAADTAEQVTDDINKFAKFMGDLAADVTELIAVPSDFAEAVRDTFSTLNGLLATIPATFDAMQDLFDFGDLDIRFTVDTAGKIERQRNRDLLNTQVQTEALSRAYVAAAQLDLPTVEDLDATQVVLEDQFQKMAAADAIDRDSFDALIKTRLALSAFFNSQRATKPRRVTLDVNTTPARVLAFSLYGSSDQGPTIAQLNSVRDSAFVEGEIEVLSS